jgi:hypothetical protein
VSCKILAQPVSVRFVHIASGIATRHSDTIDAVFLAAGQKVMVAMPCATLTELRGHENKNLSDQQLAEIGAAYLRAALERGYAPASEELRMTGQELRMLAGQLGHL